MEEVRYNDHRMQGILLVDYDSDREKLFLEMSFESLIVVAK